MHTSETGMRRIGRQTTHRKHSASPRDRSDIFKSVNAAASGQIRQLAERWLTKTQMSGHNLLALNPTRADANLGSFSINIRTGVWADFATGDAGGDIISFYAYLHGTTQIEAARELAKQMGVSS